jgi:dodecin
LPAQPKLITTKITKEHEENQRNRLCALRVLRGVISVVFGAVRPKNARMSDHVYKKIELVGSSADGFDAAVKNALTRATKTVRNMRWFEVTETRGYLEEGKISHWQVTLKVGFTLED